MMIVQIKRIILLLWMFCLTVHALFSQAHVSKDNYTGAWESPASWEPIWTAPQTTNIAGMDIIINGYITVNGSLTFSGSLTNLIINDTLVIKGDLLLDNFNNLTVNGSGILIVEGNFYFNNHAIIITNNYIVVTGNIYKGGPLTKGSFTSNSNPTKVFVGAYVYPTALTNKPNFPSLNCSSPTTTPYPHSKCSYGDMTDLINDPVYSFFQNICLTSNANSNISICAGKTINLASSSGTAYSWSGPNGFTSTIQNPSIPNASTAMAGAYKIILTSSPACIDIDTIAVAVNELPITPEITASGPTTFCSGGSVTLTSSAGTSYLWSNGATTPSINFTKSGSYTVRVTNASGCISAASSATIVTVNSLPVTPTITPGGPAAFCAGGSATLTSSAGTSYLWSNAATTQSINVTTAGSYTVQVFNESGCISAPSVSILVTVIALPEATANNNGPACAGSDLNLAGGPDEMLTYSWTGPNGFTSLLQNPSVSANATLAMTGIYTLTATNAYGCFNSATTTVVVNALPLVNAGSDITIPVGTSTSIDATVSGTGPFTYSWIPSGQLLNALIEDPVIVNLTTSTVFTLTATSIATSCSNTNAVTVTISGGALSSITTATPGITCIGGKVQLNAMASGGSGSYTYAWTSIPAGFTSSITDPIAYPTVNTTYNVAVFDGFTTFYSQVAVIVSANEIPARPTITSGGPTTFCDGGSVTLTSSAGTGYLWSTGETTESINITSTGSYTVRVTNATGCISEPSVATVTVNALPVIPTITTDGPTAFCAGGSVILTSSEGSSYLWSNGANTPSIEVTSAGSYTVIVTNADGCQSAASIATIVTVNELPSASITVTNSSLTVNNDFIICSGTTATISAFGGTSYLWSTGETTDVIMKDAAGTYTVTVTNANGCTDTKAIKITAIALPVAAITLTDNSGLANNDGIICLGANATLTASGGISYIWSSGEKTAAITKNTAGTYTVAVTDANGCTDTEAATITINALPPAAISVTDNSGLANDDGILCTGSDATLTAFGGTSYIWSSGEKTASITKGNSGVYTVTVTNSSGCTITATETLVEIALPEVEASNNGPVLTGRAINLTGVPAGMTTYSWNGPNGFTSNSQSPSVSESAITAMAGVYILTVSDASGCTNIATTKVEVNGIIPSVITPDGDGKNDYFVIGEIIDKVELIIFNRWGNEEYTNRNYLNDWDGRNNKGKELPGDTYFYILKFSNFKTIKGSVLIKR